jgi:cob(I)alamin adenosyltransferase
LWFWSPYLCLEQKLERVMGAFEVLKADLAEAFKDVGEAIGALAARIADLEAQLATGEAITAEQVAELRADINAIEDMADAIVPDVEPEPEA